MHAVSGTKPAICEICVAQKEDVTEWQGWDVGTRSLKRYDLFGFIVRFVGN